MNACRQILIRWIGSDVLIYTFSPLFKSIFRFSVLFRVFPQKNAFLWNIFRRIVSDKVSFQMNRLKAPFVSPLQNQLNDGVIVRTKPATCGYTRVETKTSYLIIDKIYPHVREQNVHEKKMKIIFYFPAYIVPSVSWQKKRRTLDIKRTTDKSAFRNRFRLSAFQDLTVLPRCAKKNVNIRE